MVRIKTEADDKKTIEAPDILGEVQLFTPKAPAPQRSKSSSEARYSHSPGMPLAKSRKPFSPTTKCKPSNAS